ncbi:MAG: tRNA (N(6)-L-threonylcarbamoyladenosine(37)-C(2))-methylthiotransferase MtaB [Chlorobi bacterium]|nr:tRNA (N(6)-L-threonylcarbamoyladenosine(37)-C(2))-methylthiotransferase MtaB [Chlorobiota bacterium]
MMKPKIAFKTLGCRLNQFETDALISTFNTEGYTIVPFREEADFYVVNTCTVTNRSDHKSRNMINQAIRRKEDATVIVTGCMANHFKDRLREQEGISYVVNNEHKHAVFSLVDAHLNGEISDPDSLPANRFGFGTTDHAFHTRSLIKIQDGCDNFCAYCIVPRVRGRAVSRPVADILDNVRHEVDTGFKEIVLTGVNIGRYQSENYNFEDLVEKILALPGDFRVRISSIEPEGFGDKLFNLFGHPKLAPHLHLCIQSGSDEVLRRMRRMYSVSSFMAILDTIRAKYPDFNFTTDIIVGFPGETERDFLQTVQVAKDAGFSHIHTFKFSKRSGTRAERMEGQIPEKVKTGRSRIIRDVSLKNKLAYYQSMLGKEQQVLFEKTGRNFSAGYGEHYLPVRVIRVLPRNTLSAVRLDSIVETGEPYLKGTLTED